MMASMTWHGWHGCFGESKPGIYWPAKEQLLPEVKNGLWSVSLHWSHLGCTRGCRQTPCSPSRQDATDMPSAEIIEIVGLLINIGAGLQGARQLPGTHASIGGKCVRASGGASAGAVALWVILSASISAGLGCAGLWWWQARHRVGSPGGDSYYQELAPSATGF